MSLTPSASAMARFPRPRRIYQGDRLARVHSEQPPDRHGLRWCVQVRHAVAFDPRRQTDIELEAEWSCDLLVEEPPYRAALCIRVPDEFRHIPTESERVVAVPRPWRPDGGLGRELRRHVHGVRQVRKCQLRFDDGESGLVAEQLPHGDGALARLCELRPVVGHLRVVGDQPARCSDRNGKRRNAFRGREHSDERVLLPRRPGDPVAETAPEIDDLAAIAVHREGGSDLLAAAQVATKRVGNLAVAVVDVTADEVRRELDLLSHPRMIMARGSRSTNAATRRTSCGRPTSGRAAVDNPRSAAGHRRRSRHAPRPQPGYRVCRRP